MLPFIPPADCPQKTHCHRRRSCEVGVVLHTRGFQHIVKFFTLHPDVRRDTFIFLSASPCGGFEQVVSDCENKSLPDKEFRSELLRGVDHFCHTLHVAMQFGLYLLRSRISRWSLAYSL